MLLLIEREWSECNQSFLFQYIHVTINQTYGTIIYQEQLSFNTSMLLLIEINFSKKIVDKLVSIHPCYY